MSFEKASSDFQCLQILAKRIEQDPKNGGWYMHRAFMLGRDCSVTEALELPPADKPNLALVKL